MRMRDVRGWRCTVSRRDSRGSGGDCMTRGERRVSLGPWRMMLLDHCRVRLKDGILGAAWRSSVPVMI